MFLSMWVIILLCTGMTRNNLLAVDDVKKPKAFSTIERIEITII